ncbi:PaaI family thioesterase [uncultured Marinobacter sp.]|uniref:PaaI family thioesterase n=1 Tax=uncultured Marinobacter sp. TaxID=187379 RepID=UPI0030DA07D7|tara:strand:+ start:69 stop:497 length:429 start_codon:yes stop_codon:yes gene_type:complete
MAIQVSAEALQAFLMQEFPQATITVEQVSEEAVWVRQPVDESHLRPGGTVSGPTMMSSADTAAYVAVLAHIGIVPLAVTSNLNINFLRKPEAGKALLAKGTVLHLGRRSVLSEVNIYSEGNLEKAVAHAVVTYAIPSSHASK